MRRLTRLASLTTGLLLSAQCSAQAEVDVSGYVEVQNRHFYQQALNDNQLSNQFSLAIEPEWQFSWQDGNHLLSFKPFYRWDNQDEERSHGDIRELMYIYVADDWELHAGIGRVFWGVTESTHLVDIINQTDYVEAIDGEDKLGQPMVKLSLVRDWGIVDAYVLPRFRERTFQDANGRFQLPLVVNPDAAHYQSDKGQHHTDFALRWAHSFDDLDLALSWFNGTSRDPQMRAQLNSQSNTPELAPFYAQIDQFGLEAQYIYLDWTFKTEAIRRTGSAIENYWALNSGFERTFYAINDTALDIGWLMELQYDSRELDATTPAQKDLFVGARLAFNDPESSEILMGIAKDLDDNDTYSMVIEGTTRIGESTKISADVWVFRSKDQQNQLYWVRKDDFVQISIQHYF